MIKLSYAQTRALVTLQNNEDNEGWMLLRDIGAQWRVVNALVRKGMVERNTVAGLSEYRAIVQAE